ncbi:hypothetical protein C8R44DRAFT_866939 [Mycena epipterygia]|nr:hypothetical protein C8R44DRAFT_866939 [Mycena epipterygia]
MHACIVAISAFFIQLSFAQISVGTPSNVAACQTVQLSWQGGIAPRTVAIGMTALTLFLSIHLTIFQSIRSASPPLPALENLGSSLGASFSWFVDPSVPAGTSVFVEVQDSTGESGRSSPFTIQPGSTLRGSENITDTGTNTGGGVTSPSSTSQAGSGDLKDKTGDSQAGSSDASAVAAVSPSAGNFVDSGPASISSSSTPTPTFPPETPSESSAQSFSAALNSVLGSSTISDPALGGITRASSTPTGNETGQTLPATTGVLSPGGASSAGPGQSTSGSDNTFSKNNVTMSGSVIAGIIAASVVCALLAACCVIRRCRRRRPDTPDRLSYPFSVSGGSQASATREMVGRSGYPASTFSSWGNHGDLADERALSPTSTPLVHGTTESQPWEGEQGTIESRYAAAFTPGHIASSSSIDRNDPTSQRRFRGPIPKSMTDALPSDAPSAIPGEGLHNTRPTDGAPVQIFDEIRPLEMPSWGTAHGMMTGRQPVVAGYPPPYTSR